MGVAGFGPDVEVLYLLAKMAIWDGRGVCYLAKLMERLVEILFLGSVVFHLVMVAVLQLVPVERGDLVRGLGILV